MMSFYHKCRIKYTFIFTIMIDSVPSRFYVHAGLLYIFAFDVFVLLNKQLV